MAQLARAVHLTDPKTKRSIVLQPGEEPAPHLAALITMPSAWEGGKVPDPVEPDVQQPAGSQPDQLPEPETEQAAPAAKKTAAKKAASKPARGRSAAAEGTSGD